MNGPNGIFPPRDGRSVSSTLHDRSRTTGTTASTTTTAMGMNVNTAAKRSSSKSRMQRNAQQIPTSSRPSSAFDRVSGQHASSMSTGSSPPGGSARETFLNYFFGQNGPGPIAGSSVERAGHHGQGSHGHGHAIGSTEFVPVGRDVSAGDSNMTSGLMAGKRGIDGNNAAYDMKSLGRHIEAVSHYFFLYFSFAVGWEFIYGPARYNLFLSNLRQFTYLLSLYRFLPMDRS